MNIEKKLELCWSSMTSEIVSADENIVASNYRSSVDREWAMLRDDFERLSQSRDQLTRYLTRLHKRGLESSSLAYTMCMSNLHIYRESLKRFHKAPSRFQVV